MWPGCRPGSGPTASAAPPGSSTGGPASGWDSLTPAEAKIAALVAQGMTNPQIAARLFLSHRTVATHVSHILGKLDVRSRIDIAREATDRRAAAG